MEDNQGCLTIVGVVVIGLILAAIPIWVYVTLASIILGGLVIWGLDEWGVFHSIGVWWEGKTSSERRHFRKRVWWVLISIGMVSICMAFPHVAIPALLGIFSYGFWCRHNRMAR